MTINLPVLSAQGVETGAVVGLDTGADVGEGFDTGAGVGTVAQASQLTGQASFTPLNVLHLSHFLLGILVTLQIYKQNCEHDGMMAEVKVSRTLQTISHP